jgi:hypothetical protein
VRPLEHNARGMRRRTQQGKIWALPDLGARAALSEDDALHIRAVVVGSPLRLRVMGRLRRRRGDERRRHARAAAHGQKSRSAGCRRVRLHLKVFELSAGGEVVLGWSGCLATRRASACTLSSTPAFRGAEDATQHLAAVRDHWILRALEGQLRGCGQRGRGQCAPRPGQVLENVACLVSRVCSRVLSADPAPMPCSAASYSPHRPAVSEMCSAL